MPASTARSLPRSVPQGTRTSRFAGLVPTSAEEFFRRRLTELGGLGHIVIAVALIGALATYYAGDPSWDMALPPAWSRHIHNLLGLGGAYFADIFIQTLGLAAYLLPLAIAAWGARLLRHRQRVPLWRRLIILFPALLV
jgi:S-DNA-T family DNA segregation ATPase FtsK/SpoIIIE